MLRYTRLVLTLSKNASWLAFAGIVFCSFASPAISGWCGKSESENWREFGSLFWAGPEGGNKDVPQVYVWAAPWCPHCAELFRALQVGSYKLQVRFIPGDAADEKSQRQMADMVTDGTNNSLVRVYSQRKAEASGYTREQRKLISEVQLVTAEALGHRFSEQGQLPGSPTSFVFVGGKVTMLPGMLKFSGIEKIAQAVDTWPRDRTRRFLSSGIPQPRPLEGTPFANRDDVRLKVLPEETAFTISCWRDGQMLPSIAVAGWIDVDGERWIVFNPFSSDMSLRIYGRGEDFDGWSAK